jgi:hypothetical protein
MCLGCTNAGTVLRLTILLVVVSHFVKVVFVQLAHETGEVAVLEMLGQNMFCEFFVLRALVSILSLNCSVATNVLPEPQNYRRRFPISQRFHR